MNLTQVNAAVNQFMSPFESVGITEVADIGLVADMTLSFNNNKQFYGYIAQVHAREPVIVGNTVTFITQEVQGYSFQTSWNRFNEQTLVNGAYTLQFVAATIEAPIGLKFLDKAMLGGANTYMPFGSSDSRDVDTHLTADVNSMKMFYAENFKHKRFRGTITFSVAQLYTKGTIIDIVDKDIKIIIVESKSDNKTGITSHTGIVLSKVI